MRLKLHNIGMISNADILLDGLTVVAGENDTGKSTAGKALFSLIKSDNIAFKQKAIPQRAKEILATRLNLVFDGNITDQGCIELLDNNNKIITKANIKDGTFISNYTCGCKSKSKEKIFDATIIQSPLVFDLVGFFNSVTKMKERQQFEYGLDFDVSYPYVLWDLYDKLSRENPFPKSIKQKNINDQLQDIIGGEFKQESGNFYYYKYLNKRALKIEMLNTAYGIKSFAILQLLNNNKFLNPKTLLILDEPEVHLHPKWQLKMAQIIVNLMNNKIKVLVNTHSPYMIEALQKYSLNRKDTHFYLAVNNEIKQINNDNSQTLSAIFSKLSEPFDEFEKLEDDNF